MGAWTPNAFCMFEEGAPQSRAAGVMPSPNLGCIRGIGDHDAERLAVELFLEAGRDARIGQAAVLDLVEQRLVADLQARGRLALVPVGARQHRADRFPLGTQRRLP